MRRRLAQIVDVNLSQPVGHRSAVRVVGETRERRHHEHLLLVSQQCLNPLQFMSCFIFPHSSRQRHMRLQPSNSVANNQASVKPHFLLVFQGFFLVSS